MWLKSLKISLFFGLVILLSCNKKEKYPEMKTGYYDVVDERLYPNGDTDTLYYKMLGTFVTQKNPNSYSFIGNDNGTIFGKNFVLPNGTTTTIINSIYVNFKIIKFYISSTELVVFQDSNDSLGYSNKITLRYIE